MKGDVLIGLAMTRSTKKVVSKNIFPHFPSDSSLRLNMRQDPPSDQINLSFCFFKFIINILRDKKTFLRDWSVCFF